jgi:hypothetical protein
MPKVQVSNEEKRTSTQHKPERAPTQPQHDTGSDLHVPVMALQNHIGNAAVQRLLAQRSGSGPTELDDATAENINRARSGGQPLDAGVQEQMSATMGHDFSGVRVHTGGESDALNQQLGAKAFTTGRDVFFRDGEYNPNSSNGQELIAHELTHVAQQGSGAVSSGGKMAVNAPGDRFEVEADSVAKTVSSIGSAPAVQRQAPEDEVQTKLAQRQEEEEPVQTKRVQRQEEEEPVQAKRIQRQEEEEPVQAKLAQRQEEEEPVQMQEEEEEVVQEQELEEEEQPAG